MGVSAVSMRLTVFLPFWTWMRRVGYHDGLERLGEEHVLWCARQSSNRSLMNSRASIDPVFVLMQTFS